MRRSILFLLTASILLSLAACGSTSSTSFFTEGNCPECEGLIVAALEEVKGVKSVSWDIESSKTTVAYNTRATDPDQIQEAVAAAGFVVQLFPPNEEKRATLPECCRQQVDRKLKQEASPH